MSYVLITADFPGVTSEQRKEIYECLELKNVTKVHEAHRDIDTVWTAYFPDDVAEIDSINSIIMIFEDCSKSYCKPKLVMQWGPHRPTRYGLV